MNVLGESVSNRIRELRLSAGMTQQELADKADIDWSAFSRIERGKSINMQINTLDKIINALEIDYPEFFSFSDSPHIKHRIIAKLSLVDNDDKILKIFDEILDWKND